METLAALLAILGYGLYINHLTKCPLESTLLAVCSSLICLLYLSGLSGYLQIAAQLLLGVGVALFVAGLYSRWKSKTLLESLSPGMLFFLLSAIGLWMLTRSEFYSIFVLGDDYSHWGRMTKIIVSNNRLVIPGDAIVIKDYPPGMALFDYLFLQFGGFSEGRAMFAHGVFIIAAFASLFSVIPKTVNRSVLLGLNIFLYALINSLIWFLGTGLHTLCVDLILGVVFGIALFGYLAERKNGRLASTIRLVPLVMVLPLIKLIGILFSAVIAGIVVCDIILGSISNKEKVKLIVASLFLMASCYVIYLSWGEHVKNMGTGTTFSTAEISPGNVIKAFISESASQRQKSTIDFFTRSIFSLNSFPNYWLVLCILFFWLIWRTAKDYNFLEKVIPFAILLGSFYAYLFVLLVLYLFSFSAYEGMRLASLDRYVNTYLVGMVIVFFGVSLSQYFSNKQNRTTTITLIVICFLAMFPNSEKGGIDVARAINGWGWGEVGDIVQYSKVIERMTPPNARVYFIWQGGSNDESVVFNYGIFPRMNNTVCSSVGELYPRPNGDDVWTCRITPSEFEQKLMSYDYLLIARADQKFKDRFLAQFSFDTVQDGTLFEILKDTNHVKLKGKAIIHFRRKD